MCTRLHVWVHPKRDSWNPKQLVYEYMCIILLCVVLFNMWPGQHYCVVYNTLVCAYELCNMCM